jgi:hypothetical protein
MDDDFDFRYTTRPPQSAPSADDDAPILRPADLARTTSAPPPRFQLPDVGEFENFARTNAVRNPVAYQKRLMTDQQFLLWHLSKQSQPEE